VPAGRSACATDCRRRRQALRGRRQARRRQQRRRGGGSSGGAAAASSDNLVIGRSKDVRKGTKSNERFPMNELDKADAAVQPDPEAGLEA